MDNNFSAPPDSLNDCIDTALNPVEDESMTEGDYEDFEAGGQQGQQSRRDNRQFHSSLFLLAMDSNNPNQHSY
jgi:hypothetical protein